MTTRTSAIDALTATAERDGHAPLPALTQADLCALGAAQQALLCQATWDWWTGLGPDGREQAAASSLGLLAYRGLLTPAKGRSTPAVPVPELGLILAARSAPEPLVTCQVPGQDATRNPRFFGITQNGRGLRALVCELLTTDPAGPGDSTELGTILIYSLVTPEYAAQMLTTYARLIGTHAPGQTPVVDVYAHDGTGQLTRDRHEVRWDDGTYEVGTPGTPLPPRKADEMLAAQLLTQALTGAAR